MNEFKDPELESRRQLLAEARKGRAMAQAELLREYHVKVYSAAERKKLCSQAGTKAR